uniref:NIP3 homolog (projected from Caenorhabditis elegans ortholog dct-1) n=1 Tax=Strongyloides venezuelensis TaxID=75913 RepID=A0A0K0FAY2_STRVS
MSTFFENKQSSTMDISKKIILPNNHIPKVSEDCESMPESWCELAPSRDSYCSSLDVTNLVLIGKDGESKFDSRASPTSLNGPYSEVDRNMEQVRLKLQREGLSSVRGQDWIWDWSTRSEQNYNYSKNFNKGTYNNSALTTPPNSPEPYYYEGNIFEYGKSSKKYPSHYYMISLVASHLCTLLLGTTMGYYLFKRFGQNITYFR